MSNRAQMESGSLFQKNLGMSLREFVDAALRKRRRADLVYHYALDPANAPTPFITEDDITMQREFNRRESSAVEWLATYRPIPTERAAEIYAKLERWGA